MVDFFLMIAMAIGVGISGILVLTIAAVRVTSTMTAVLGGLAGLFLLVLQCAIWWQWSVNKSSATGSSGGSHVMLFMVISVSSCEMMFYVLCVISRLRTLKEQNASRDGEAK
jgi:hypothetical protein